MNCSCFPRHLCEVKSLVGTKETLGGPVWLDHSALCHPHSDHWFRLCQEDRKLNNQTPTAGEENSLNGGKRNPLLAHINTYVQTDTHTRLHTPTHARAHTQIPTGLTKLPHLYPILNNSCHRTPAEEMPKSSEVEHNSTAVLIHH